MELEIVGEVSQRANLFTRGVFLAIITQVIFAVWEMLLTSVGEGKVGSSSVKQRQSDGTLAAGWGLCKYSLSSMDVHQVR